ncbi:TMEM175 family protein [Herbiconiux sp.]|uniref:TMEM175 family protein n=1 Tax=Herbiconiux sp. TaxID=1871186 RepID=UPI0025C67090|nr:TMEM175 family protein [Herbiconiux sp.]
MADEPDTLDEVTAVVAAEDDRRGLDRLVFFTDAVIAIAITLVVLPLVDVARDATTGIGTGTGESARTTADFFADNGLALLAAAVSFAVISSYWREHHRIFLHAARSNRLLITVNLLWLAGIAFLPLATVLKVDAPSTDALANVIYIGTIGVTSTLLRVEEFVLTRAGLYQAGFTPTLSRLAAHWTPVVLTTAALVIATVWPALGLYPLLLLLFSAPIQWLWRRPRRIRSSTGEPSL